MTITHLIAYFWDNKMYHPEILEEGLAEYLHAPKSNNYFIHHLMIKKSEHLKHFSLNVKPYTHTTNYAMAGSFVKFLIERYGIEKFRQLYVSTALERKDQIFYLDGKKLSKNFLKKSLQQIYKKDHKRIQQEWKKTVKSLSKHWQHFSSDQIKRIPGTDIFSISSLLF